MSTFQPVELPEGRELGDRASQTFLRAYNGCPRSAFFYQSHKGSVRTVEMMRGSALHMVLERSTALMVESGEATIPPELVKAIVNEVLAEMPVPFEEHDYIREMSYRWAGEWMVDPSMVIANETLIVLDVDGFQVRCKVDFAETRPNGIVRVADYKSAKGAPAYDEIARKLNDGRLAAKSFQLVLYALALAFGLPVAVERCYICSGVGRRSSWVNVVGAEVGGICPDCEGSARLERAEPFPLASRAELFELQYVYPGIEDSEGLMLRRTVYLNRLELAEYRESLASLVRRVRASEESGDWPAVLSDAACSECPCPVECPIPVELRGHRGTINTLEEAAEAALVLDRRSAVDRAIRRKIKLYAKATGQTIPLGEDREWAFVTSEKREIKDRAGMACAIEDAVRLGKPFDLDDWQRTSVGTNFAVRKVSGNDDGRVVGDDGG